jgi:hypothetical protein
MMAMYTCDQCSERFWDHLYGLMDEAEAQSVREHLAGCPACRAALAEAESGQKLVAAAARMYDMAPFTPPAAEPEQSPAPASPALIEVATAQRETIPLPPPARQARSRWPWLAAAASVLLVIGGYAWYQSELHNLREKSELAWAAVRDVKVDITRVNRRAQEEADRLPADLRRQGLQLALLGPASYQRNAPNQYRVVSKDLNDAPATTVLTARVLGSTKGEQTAQRLLKEMHFTGRGERTFSLPADLPVDALGDVRLELQAQGGEKVQAPLHVVPPSYVTHLALDKVFYHPGERLFFRALALDRFTDRPAANQVSWTASLLSETGMRKGPIPLRTDGHGVGAGSFLLTDQLPPGKWVLEVTDPKHHLPPVRRRFVLLQDAVLQFDKLAYQAGDTVHANLRAWRAANQPVKVTVEFGGQKAENLSFTSRVNGRGETAFRFKVPPGMANGNARLNVELPGRGRKETLSQLVPLANAAFDMEFFPEGGVLIDGLPSRVYFRARRDGMPADVKGQVIDSRGNRVAQVASEGQQGLGDFRFTPKAGEAYQLRIDSPTGIDVRPKLPAIQATGLALSVPAGVSREEEPLPVLLRAHGKDRGVIVTATFRGRVVDQQAVRVGDKETRVVLKPAAGSHGVLRVTAYEPQEGQLTPLAERLVYRAPVHRLQVSVTSDKPAYAPGDRAALTFQTKDEQGRPASSVLLAAVVDERALGWTAQAAMARPAPYYLSSHIRAPQELEEATIWVRDDAAAHAALDRFLGTQGWRRFFPSGQSVPKTMLAKAEKFPRGPASEALPAVLNLDNRRAVRQQYEKQLKEALGHLDATTRQREQELEKKRALLANEATQTEAALADWEELPRSALRWGLAGLVLVLLTAAAVALLIGIVRTVRGSGVTTPFFATAFGSLLACVIVVLAGRDGGTAGARVDAPRSADAGDADRGLPQLGANELALRTTPVIPQGVFAAAGRVPVEQDGREIYALGQLVFGRSRALLRSEVKMKEAPDETKKAMEKMQTQRAAARRADLMQKKGPPNRDKKANAPAPAAKKAKGLGTLPAPKAAMPKSLGLPAGRAGGAGAGLAKFRDRAPKDGVLAAVPVLYAHDHRAARKGTGLDSQDTLLWVPALDAPGGRAAAAFDLSDKVTTFRILVYGHTADGRLGLARGELVSQPNSLAKPPRSK